MRLSAIILAIFFLLPLFGETQELMELHQYLNPDGSFNYQEYKRVQTEGNKRKINQVWVLEENVKLLSDYLKEELDEINFGLCHGTRNGAEQAWFRKYLGCDVLGTEISDTAEQFPDTIQWDFHNVKPEWVGSVDFIYSNSLDHSYDPEMCLKAWMSCLRPGGICIIEHTTGHEHAKELDPFGASLFVMPYLILDWGDGEFGVTEILDGENNREHVKYTKFLIIRNFEG